MRIVAVDLAAKYSAACTITAAGVIMHQIDSWGRTEADFVNAITAPWSRPRPPTALIVEDLPHGVPYMTVTKIVCRLQGRIIDRMHGYNASDALSFAAPNIWRKHFELKNGTGPAAVVDTADRLGYRSPDLTHRVSKTGDRAIARKVGTDYCSAYLIAHWALTAYRAHGSFTFPGLTKHD